MGIEWFGRWVIGGRIGRCKRWGFGGLCCWYGCWHIWCWVRAESCCMSVVYIVEWAQSRGALVWRGRSKGFAGVLSSVGDAWVQAVVRVQFHV
jgi:hypothetical protein